MTRHAAVAQWPFVTRFRSRLDVAALSLGAFLVLSVGLTDGGYYGRATSKLAILLVAAALLAVVAGVRPRPSRPFAAQLAAMALLTVWIGLSSSWAAQEAAVGPETRRSALYLAALATMAVLVDARRRLPFLTGLLGAICVIAGLAVAMRVVSGATVDRLYGTLLEEPIGYPNALGVLVAIGAVLCIGLGPALGAAWSPVLGTAAPFLVFVLGLTESRGAGLALVLGLVALVMLANVRDRGSIAVAAGAAVVIGGAAWAFVQWRGAEGATLMTLTACVLAAGSLRTRWTFAFGRRALPVLVAVVLASVVLVALRPPSLTTSHRSEYWRAALAEAREHPLLGSGAGTFYLSWREHRSSKLGVRDAHSLYVETLSELGPGGLTLVLALAVLPLAVAVRRRGDPLVVAAGASYLVFAAHAAIDWDWEMPVVTLAGLACAAVVLAGDAHRTRPNDPHRRKEQTCW